MNASAPLPSVVVSPIDSLGVRRLAEVTRRFFDLLFAREPPADCAPADWERLIRAAGRLYQRAGELYFASPGEQWVILRRMLRDCRWCAGLLVALATTEVILEALRRLRVLALGLERAVELAPDLVLN